MKKNYKGEILFIVISMFITSCIWVGSDIYNKHVVSTIDKTLQFQTQPISNTFDLETVNKVKSRQKIAPNLISTPRVVASESAEPTPTDEINEATPIVNPTEVPVGNEGVVVEDVITQ